MESCGKRISASPSLSWVEPCQLSDGWNGSLGMEGVGRSELFRLAECEEAALEEGEEALDPMRERSVFLGLFEGEVGSQSGAVATKPDKGWRW